MQFQEIPGHIELKKALIGAHANNHLAHAQLFSGNNGSGALSLALAFATYLFCENKTGEDSCGDCSSCQKMHRHVHPDMHYFYPIAKPDKNADEEGARQSEVWRNFVSSNPYSTLDDLITAMGTENKQNQISKSDARQIIKTVSMKSFEGGYKILLIWYPELMHPSAANAILKVLEEPPRNTIYLMVTHGYENLLTTILSRVQLINVPSFSDNEICEYLIRVKGIDPAFADRVSKLAFGNMNQAFAELSSEEHVEFQQFQNWMRACFQNNFLELSAQSEEFGKSPKSGQRQFIRFSMELVRNSILRNQAVPLIKSEADELAFITKFGEALSIDALEKLYLDLSQTLGHLERNANPKITFMALSIRLSQIVARK